MAIKGGVKGQMLRFTKLLRKLVDDGSNDRIMKAVGEEAVRLVQQQAKLGNDYKGGKFKKLSPEYVEKRRRYSNDLHQRTRPRRSNVTATGQMLDSLKVSSIRARSVELECSGSRRKSPFGGARTNAEVGYWVEKNGRHWLGMDEKTRKKLVRFYDRLVRALVRGL